MVSRPFSAFEKESLEIAGRLSRRPGSRSRYEADLRQWHASEMARSRSHDVLLYATQYGYSVGSTLIERVLRCLDIPWWEKGCFAAPWVELRRLLSESQSSSSERRHTHGTPKMYRLTFLWRLVDISDSATTIAMTSPRPGDASPTTTASFFACLSMTQDRTTTYRWRHARQQPDFLLLFGTCGDSLSCTTTGDGAAEWIKTIVLSSPFSSTSNRRTELKLGTTDLRGPRNTLVQTN